MIDITNLLGDTHRELGCRRTDSGQARTLLIRRSYAAPIPELIELQGRQVDPVLNDPETGMWGMGTGWEMGLIALDRFLRREMPDGYDAESFEATPEIMELANRCGEEWAAVAGADST